VSNKLLCAVSAAAFLALSFPTADAGADYAYKTVIVTAHLIDGKKVTYRGEVVTAVMKRGLHSWVNINDGNNAIGVWAESPLLEPVRFFGDYKHTGDILEVEGVFHRACPMHGGELDIHADKVVVVKSGFAREERVDARRIYITVLLFLAAIVGVLLFRKRV